MKHNSDFKYDVDLGLLGEKLTIDILCFSFIFCNNKNTNTTDD